MRFAAAFSLCILIGAAQVNARTVAPFIAFAEPMEAPRGFTEMCGTAPAACTAHVGGEMEEARRDDRRLIDYVNRRVNGGVQQRLERKITGRVDAWRASGVGAGASGDCKDLALEKRAELIASGYPADHLFLAVVYGRGSIGLHAVLVARMNDGDLVLDSRSAVISRWSDSRYVWISVQSPQEPTRWYRPTPDALVSASS